MCRVAIAAGAEAHRGRYHRLYFSKPGPHDRPAARSDNSRRSLDRKREPYQEEAAFEIQKRFPEHFIYTNENGNPAISKDVLREFRKLTGDAVFWERSYRCWRRPAKGDPEGRRQID